MKQSILYIASRYPKITETFVINEWLALRGRYDMHLAALRRSRERLVHPDAARVLPHVWFPRSFDLATLTDHARWLMRRPRVYLSTLLVLVAGSATRPRELGKSVLAFSKAIRLATRVRESSVEHVHAHFANHPTTAAWIVHRLTGVPFSFTAHANDLFLRPVVLDRKVAEAAFVVAISEYNAKMLARWFPHARVHVVHCGVDTDRFVPRADPVERRRLLCVASLEPKKGQRYLLEAVSLLRQQGMSLHVVLAGDGPDHAALEQRARELGIDRIDFLGPRTSEQIAAELQRADVFVLPSIPDATGRMEGIPVALMEAMASGVPVVSTQLSGIPELVSGAGVLVEPKDTRGLASAIARVVDDDNLARRLSDLGRARVEKEFDLVTQADRLADLFEGSLAR
ncbi:MAG: glycosyltransferase [Acidimicrobiia bacterium]